MSQISALQAAAFESELCHGSMSIIFTPALFTVRSVLPSLDTLMDTSITNLLKVECVCS